MAAGAECEAGSNRHSLDYGALGSEIGLEAQSVELGCDAGAPSRMAGGLRSDGCGLRADS